MADGAAGADADEGTPPRLVLGDDGVATLTLNRPRHLNRLHREDLLALQAHCRTLAAEPGLRLVVLAAQGRVFCAGFNLQQLSDAAAQDSAGDDPRLFEHTVDALAALPVPTLARLQGSVYGGATDLALACDFRLGVQGLELRMPAARIGLHYYPSGLRRAVARLGLGAAKRLFLLGEAVPADELLRLGYLDALVPPEALDEAVARHATALRQGAPLALRGMKQSLDEIAEGRADEARLREREALCAASADLREGLAALTERRQALFLGR